MPHPRAISIPCCFGLLSLLVSLLSLCTPARAGNTTTDGIQWIEYTNNNGQTVWLENNRKPALYTQDFGDCQGDSLINVTRFDAAYYADNMTVLFHLGGSSVLTNESLMLYIGVFAYGESRFDLTFNPCNANIDSLCPLNSSIPIQASGIIPVAPSDVAGIPSIALTIPDFEGQAILRIFANSTQSQIACFSAVVTNGASFSHPAAIGSLLGVFTVIALFSSVAVAIYGQYVPETRKHYAHSLSMFVVFSVLQHVYFTGSLSMNWPSVLVAFWSNYAWAAGMIYSEAMQTSINKFLGGNLGNISMVGSAPSGQNALDLGGGFQISQIYKRNIPLPTAVPAVPAVPLQTFDGSGSTLRSRAIEHTLARRDLVNSSSGFSWYGSPVRPGLPLPGNFSGFAGTLAEEKIPASNAFLTGLIWFVVLVGLVAVLMIVLKWTIEALAAARIIKTERLSFFREHWLRFTGAALLRTIFIAFFMMMYLTMFQFAFTGPTGVIALAAVTFVVFFLGMLGSAAYAVFYQRRSGRFQTQPQGFPTEANSEDKPGHSKWYSLSHNFKLPSKNIIRTDQEEEQPDRLHVHDDELYIKKFGWLASRFRRSKWWFFAFWLIYEFVRACFYGAAAGHALTQVFGLLAVEILALIAIVLMKPFESNRLNLLMIYLLGFSKVATVALSSAFDTRFNLGRITTTVIGIVIIVIQGLLTICLMIAIVLGAISSYFSVMRNREEIRPRSWNGFRERYFKHIDQKTTDQPPPPPPPPPPEPEKPTGPYFAVAGVRREPKIEDEEPETDEMVAEPRTSQDPEASNSDKNRPASRSQSLTSRTSMSHLPYGARRHRTSWSARDFSEMMPDGPEQIQSGVQSRMSIESIRDTTTKHRAASLTSRTEAPYVSAEPERPETADATAEKRHKRRSLSGGLHPLRPAVKRNSSIVPEETENDS